MRIASIAAATLLLSLFAFSGEPAPAEPAPRDETANPEPATERFTVVPEGSAPVPPERLPGGGKLLLPTIKGSLKAPDEHWTWYSGKTDRKGVELYFCIGPAQEIYVVVLAPEKRRLRGARLQTFRKDLDDLAQTTGGTILSDEGEFKPLPPHADVFYMKARIRIQDEERLFERFLVPTGDYVVLFSALTVDEPTRTQFSAVAASLKFTAKPRVDFLMFVYFLVGGTCFIFWFIINEAMGRTVVRPAVFGIVAILGVLLLRVALTPPGSILNNHPGDKFAFFVGEQIGLAFIPLVILIVLGYFGVGVKLPPPPPPPVFPRTTE